VAESLVGLELVEEIRIVNPKTQPLLAAMLFCVAVQPVKDSLRRE
jgi:hypothetical protein